MPTRSDKTKNSPPSRSSQKRKKKSTKKKGSIWKRIFLTLFSIGFIGLAVGAGFFIYYASNAPELDREALVDPVPWKILAKDGTLIKEVGASSENRELVSLNDIPQVLQDAVISIEDQRFYDHLGVDPIRIIGATLANFSQGGVTQGGSTITQQLIKLSFFSTSEEDQTLERKAQEAWMAIQLERKLPKDEILALYINKVFMGNNAYGMGTAANYYFGKELADITLAEAATLAGMPQAPSFYDPYVNPAETKERRDLVLQMMLENEKISQAQYDEAVATDVTANLVDHSTSNDYSLVIDAYLQMALEEVHEKTGLGVETSGLTIQTNLDLAVQQHLYDIVNSDTYIWFPDDEIQTAVTMVDVNTGAIQAVIGNRKNENQMGINYANQNIRDIGSTIKPLIDYGPAIEYLDYSTGHTVVDEEYTFQDGSELFNYDRLFKGKMTLRESLVDSRNVPAAKLLQEVGYENASSFLSKLGIDASTLNSQEDGLVESNAIRGDLSSVDLAAAYAAFANGGKYYVPFTVQSVSDENGILYEAEPIGKQAMKDSTAFMITDMLKDVIPMSAPEASVSYLPQAGKTGTSNFTDEELETVGAVGLDNIGKDSWFVGYTTNFAISVWLGYPTIEEGNYLTYETRTLSRYIYSELMSFASSDIETADWTPPASVEEATIEKYTSPLAKPGPNTPSDMKATEWFVKGSTPSQVSKVYGEAFKAPTGLRATYDQKKNELTVQWDALKLESSDNRTPQYTLTVGNQSSTTTNTSVVLKNPPKGNVTVSVVAKVGQTTTPAATVTITIEEPEKEKPKPTEPEPESSSSKPAESSSSENSSSSESVPESSSQPESESSSESSSEVESVPESSSQSESDSAA